MGNHREADDPDQAKRREDQLPWQLGDREPLADRHADGEDHDQITEKPQKPEMVKERGKNQLNRLFLGAAHQRK